MIRNPGEVSGDRLVLYRKFLASPIGRKGVLAKADEGGRKEGGETSSVQMENRRTGTVGYR
jgi:hypothetical protein